MTAGKLGAATTDNPRVDILGVGRPVPDALAQSTVWDLDGGSHALSKAWTDGAALIVFIRHFECAACSMNVADLAPRIGELARLDVATTIVGCGPITAIAPFIAKFGLQPFIDEGLRVWTDPTLAVHAAAKLKRGVMRSVGVRAIANFFRILARGHFQSKHAGNGAQQGGALIVDSTGRLTLLHRNERLGEFARAVDLVEAAIAARVSGLTAGDAPAMLLSS